MRVIILTMVFCVLISCKPDTDIAQTVLSQPSKVELIFPENNSVCTTGTILSESQSEVVFEWSNAEIGDLYELHLTNMETGEESIYQSANSSMAITLYRGTPYRWEVSTFLLETNEATKSDFAAFYNAGEGITTHIPFPASAIYPRNGEHLLASTQSTTLQWSAEDLDNDIVAYDIYFGTINPPMLFAENNTNQALENVSVESGQSYYWSISTRDSQGNIFELTNF